MKRRNFLQCSTAALPLLLGKFSLGAMANMPFWSSILNNGIAPGKILVLIQLDGGNDGLSTVIPLDKYSALSKARKNILIPEKKALTLYNQADTGFHPS